MKDGRKLIIVTLFLLILPLLGTSCRPKVEEKAEEKKIPVNLSVVTLGSVNREISLTGTVRSRNKVAIFSKISGIIQSVLVDEGDHVKPGDLLIQLDDRELCAQLNQARASLNMARAQVRQAESGYDLASSTTGIQVNVAAKAVDQAKEGSVQARSRFNNAELEYNRMKELYANGAISRQALDQATTQYEVAKSQYEASQAQIQQAQENFRLAKANTGQAKVSESSVQTAYAGIQQAQANVEYLEAVLANTQLRAPISGYVTLKSLEPGELISPGDKTPAIEITNNSILYLEAEVPESDASKLHRGRPVDVVFDALNRSYPGEIETIIAAADPRSRTFRVKISIKNSDGTLKNGMSGTAKLIAETYNGVVIPRSWLKVIEGEFYVVQVDDNLQAISKKVNLGYYNEEKALVIDNLSAGEKIVSTGQELLRDGDSVQIVNDEEKNPTKSSGISGNPRT